MTDQPSTSDANGAGADPDRESTGMPRGVRATLIVVAVVVLVVVAIMLIGGGHDRPSHGADASLSTVREDHAPDSGDHG